MLWKSVENHKKQPYFRLFFITYFTVTLPPCQCVKAYFSIALSPATFVN